MNQLDMFCRHADQFAVDIAAERVLQEARSRSVWRHGPMDVVNGEGRESSLQGGPLNAEVAHESVEPTELYGSIEVPVPNGEA